MPVITRAQARRVLEEEFATLRSIDLDYLVYPDTILATQPNAGAQNITHSGPYFFQSPESPTPLCVQHEHCTPESTPPTAPSPPEPANQLYTTRATADADMRLLFVIKKGEDIREALKRHLGLYEMESKTRKRENQRRVCKFVEKHPHLLQEVNKETEPSVHDDSS
ncbi:hypothetical protein AN958_09837 [Leucoagaricus sp. SymC.cos]|nr:hypothetical protein AN958_09837 [Leucoagaricus sp. SymC.cos]